MKIIPEYPNYSVSRKGFVINNKTKRKLKSRITSGYNMVLLYNGLGSRNLKVSRLVAKAYVTNPNNYPIVNHLNGDKLDDHYGNLVWDTHSGNTIHAYKNNLIDRVKPKGRFNGNSRKLLVYDKQGNKLRVYPCIKEGALELGISPRYIRLCRENKRNHRKFNFKIK